MLEMQAPPLDPEHCEFCKRSAHSSSGCWYPPPAIITADRNGQEPTTYNGRRRKRMRRLRAGAPYAFEVYRRFCYYCGRLLKHYDKMNHNAGWGDASTRDHVVPLSKGGTREKQNLVNCCWLCNQTKASRNHDDFMDDLIEHNSRIVLSSGASLAAWEHWVARLSALGGGAAIAAAAQS